MSRHCTEEKCGYGIEKSPKILLLGTLNAEILVRQLRYYGADAEVMSPSKFLNPLTAIKFDVIYGIYLMSIARFVPLIKVLGKKLLVHIIGSDAFKYAETEGGIKKRLWNLTLNSCNEILYVTDELKQLLGLRRGKVIPIPIDTNMFKKSRCDVEKRDVLYYCPEPEIYRLDWIVKYAEEHPDETITILGHNPPLDLPNVEVIPHAPYWQMPKLYTLHRRLIRMTTRDGYPKMPYEALLCGLEVVWNGQKVTKIPVEMLMENTIPTLITILTEL